MHDTFFSFLYCLVLLSQADSRNIVPWSSSEKVFQTVVDDNIDLLRQYIAEGIDVNCPSDNVLNISSVQSNSSHFFTFFFLRECARFISQLIEGTQRLWSCWQRQERR